MSREFVVHAYPYSDTANQTPDFVVPAAQELCDYIPSHHILRASLRSPSTDLQPAHNAQTVFAGCEEEWRYLLTPRLVPVQHEGACYILGLFTCAKLTVLQLNSIDNMRKDGKFMVGSDIPDGQGSVTQLLEECFELAYELRTEAEEAG
jgi:hypothetical protein